MDVIRQQELRALIRSLDPTSAPPRTPREAERDMAQILKALLCEEGYTVQSTSADRDAGMDFVARRGEDGDPSVDEIAIEYKHYRQAAVGADVVRQLVGATVVAGLPRAMLVTNARFTFAARELIRRNAPVSIQLVDLDALRSWVGRLEEVTRVDLPEVALLRTGLSRRLIPLIAKNPRYLDEIEWRELEHLMREVFAGLGFEAELTPGSKDGGKDIILTCRAASEAHTYYVELKHWRSGQRVGHGVVTEFLNVIVNEEVAGGVLLSTYGFCSNAVESLTQIQRQRLRFGSEDKIVALCKSYVKATSGIWSTESSSVEVLYDGTF